MTFKPLILPPLLCALFILACTVVVRATVKVSHDDGRWNEIYWSPAGAPKPGDTVVIASHVVGLPAIRFGKLQIRPWGTLSIEGGEPEVTGCVNDGALIIDRSATLLVAGDLVNNGAIAGEGIVRMTHAGSTISGGGAFGHLAVGAVPGSTIHLAGSIIISSLSLATECRLALDGHDLTVNGPYSSASELGGEGIVEGVGGGVIMLNGSIYGSARGNVVIGTVPGGIRSRRALPPEVHGVLGDTAGTVRFMASRRIGFSTLLGVITIDSGARLEGTGIGANGSNTIQGSLTIDPGATLAAADESYRWNIDGDLRNEGRIDPCTMVMRGFRSRIRSDRGIWDQGINLIYAGPSAGELQLDAPITLSKLTIVPRSPLDSNVAIIAGPHPLKIRHRFVSDIGRGCRIVTDTVVKIWGKSDGMVEGSVLFEGFWGYPVAGRYGAAGREVRFATRKEITGDLVITGSLINDPPSPLTIRSTASISGSGRLRGEVILHPEGSMTVEGNLTLERRARGGGTIHLIDPASLLDAGGAISDSVLLEIGRDTASAVVTLTRTLNAARILIHPGSSLTYGPGDSISVSRDLRYMVSYATNFSSAAAAVVPNDPRAALIFAGNSSVLRYQDGYIAEDTIIPGAGYYIRFPVATTVTHTGKPINAPLTTPIHAGWNLIGGPSIPISTSSITVTGTTLLSGFLNTLGGAQSVATILPGRGYWVNAAGEGEVVMRP